MSYDIASPATVQSGSGLPEAVLNRGQIEALVNAVKNRGVHTGQQAFSTISDGPASVSAIVNAAIAALIGDAPAALDTLGEIADALKDNPNAVDALTALISALTTRVTALEVTEYTSAAIAANTPWTITHNRNKRVEVQVVRADTGQEIYPVKLVPVGNVATLDFGSASFAAGALIARVR